MLKESKILITGGTGMLGTFLAQQLKKEGYSNIVCLGSKECNLLDWEKTKEFFLEYKPDYVFHLAAAVFGIMGNMKQKGLSFFQNTMINLHVIEASHLVNVKKIVAMGSGAAYPYPSPGLPLKEEMVWDGKPHAAEDSYGHSKRAMLAQLTAYQENYDMDYAFVLSCNLYGPYDKFDTQFGHVVPSLIRKFYEAKEKEDNIMVWGDGSAKRDFLYAEDAANALVHIMKQVTGPVNMGSGAVSSIKNIVNFLGEYTHQENKIIWDASKPNGQDYRAYDLTLLQNAGFTPKYSLEEGLKITFDWYEKNASAARK